MPKKKNQNPIHLRRTTMADVAESASVSLITVSRVIRFPDMVSPQKREKVRKAIEELDYIPDLTAGSLSSKKSGIIAVIIPSTSNPVFSTTLQGISDCLASQHYHLMLGASGLSWDGEESLVKAFLGRRPDGFILTGGGHSPNTRKILIHSGIPVIETWSLISNPIDMNIGFSNQEAAYSMTRYLAKSGRKKIGLICGSTRYNDRAQSRKKGYLKALKEFGLDEDLIQTLPFPAHMEDASKALQKLLGKCPDLDAVFCSGDTFALGALFECQRQNRAVPKKIAIAGLGDMEMSEQVVPRLTTAKIPGYKMGFQAAEMLLKRLTGESILPKVLDIGFEIVVRESS